MRPHGTRACYQYDRCRCDACSAANAAYASRTRALRRNDEADRAAMTPPRFRIPAAVKGQHGTGPDVNVTPMWASWRKNAACVGNDPNLWDIDSSVDQWFKGATICAECPVRQQCLTDHLGNLDAFGIYAGQPLWAGMPLERKTA